MSSTMINIILIILCFLFGSLPLLIPFLKGNHKGDDSFFTNHKTLVAVSFFLILGSLVRVSFLDSFPSGLNQDEASAGYEAFAILTTGMDRHGNQAPVHFVSWGSGQNVLYSYLAIPFIALLGNTTIALRLPMALLSCVTLYALYYTIASLKDEKTALLFLAFLAINPWHISKSRWALESNLFPELVLLTLLLLLYSIRKKKYVFFYLSAFLFGLSSYSYGTSYFFLFFFILSLLVYLAIRKEVKLIHLFCYLFTVFVTCIPIILFLYVNLFDKDTIRLLWFDIPKLTQDRFHSVTSFFSKTFFQDCLNNITSTFALIFTQYDGLPWNATEFFGTMYLFTLPFSLIGLFHPLYKSSKEDLTASLLPEKRSEETYQFALTSWFIVSLFLGMFIKPNINRVNTLWFPLILFAAQGISDVIQKVKSLTVPLSLLYLSSFVAYGTYQTTYFDKNRIQPNFYYGFKEACLYAKDLNPIHTYVTPKANYTLLLYYTEYDVNTYIDTVIFTNPGSAFENVKSFKGYTFSLPQTVQKGFCYIVSIYDKLYQESESLPYETTSFGNFCVIDCTI